MAVQRTILHHDDLAVALENGRLDLANLLVEQHADVLLAVDDRLPRFAHADRAQRVGLARPAERRFGFLIRLQQRLVGPLRRERWPLINFVEAIEHDPRAVGGEGQTLLEVFNWPMHWSSSVDVQGAGVTAPQFTVNDRRQKGWPITLSANGPLVRPIGPSTAPKWQNCRVAGFAESKLREGTFCLSHFLQSCHSAIL